MGKPPQAPQCCGFCVFGRGCCFDIRFPLNLAYTAVMFPLSCWTDISSSFPESLANVTGADLPIHSCSWRTSSNVFPRGLQVLYIDPFSFENKLLGQKNSFRIPRYLFSCSDQTIMWSQKRTTVRSQYCFFWERGRSSEIQARKPMPFASCPTQYLYLGLSSGSRGLARILYTLRSSRFREN